MDKKSVCIYVAPQGASAINRFDEMKTRSDLHTETFASMKSLLNEIKDSCHQFYFKYPLQSAEQAKTFAKVLQIKALVAHRFVPVILDCRFITLRNLGFLRRIEIADGPIAQEHVLVDSATDSVIFIEEFTVMPNEKIQPGAFAALNSIIEENGSWYFSGVYLYADPLTDNQVQENKTMFRLTYENMLDFMKNNDVDLIFNACMSHLKIVE